ncbi:hypothetical protein FRC07_012943, partial [Ceratobasidium sp. 392]
MDIAAQHQAAGLTRKRARRQFDLSRPPPALRTAGEPEDESDSLPDPPAEMVHSDNDADLGDDDSEDESGAHNLTTLAAQFDKALDEDNDEGVDDDLPAPSDVLNQPSTRPRRLRLYFSKAHAIPLSEVFNFSGSVEGVEEGLGVFWSLGVTNLAKERNVCEAVASMH